MKTTLKILGLVFLALYFTACAPSSGSGGGDGGNGTPTNPVPDNTPRDYRIAGGREANGVTINNEMTMVCNFGFAGERTTQNTAPLSNMNPNIGLEQLGCKNVTIQLKNLGVHNIVFSVYIDGAVHLDNVILLPGQSYNLQRGF